MANTIFKRIFLKEDKDKRRFVVELMQIRMIGKSRVELMD